MPNTQSLSLLSNVYLFKNLTASELDLVSAIPRVETFNPGDEIFGEGDEAQAIYIIKYGTVRISHSGRNQPTEVATLGTGSHFGEMAFLDSEKRSASAIAVERTEMIALGFDDMRRVLEANPVVAAKVYKALAHFLCGRLRITTTDLSFAREKNLRHF
jgi:CRP/FNR family cyclic AMP-dependent transcriptional regulator